MAVVTVQDSGRGVPEDLLRHIFEPFYRVSVAEEYGPANEGSGLGLSISERIVSLYGGAITAHNAEAGGLAVVIELSPSQLAVLARIYQAHCGQRSRTTASASSRLCTVPSS